MPGTCWVCQRQAHGLGHSDHRFGVGEPRRYPMDWVFCSRRCQEVFHTLYGQWLKAARRKEDVFVVDASEIERAAMHACLRFFGEAANEIGFERPLGHYSEAQALQVIEAIVTGWTEAMAAHHSEAKYPPVRGIERYETQAPQPVGRLEPIAESARTPASASDLAHPFADLEDGLLRKTGGPAAARAAPRGRAR